MASLFRHQQGRDRQPVSHAADSDQSDQDEFQMGTTLADSTQHQHKAADADGPAHDKSAVALAESKLPAPAEAPQNFTAPAAIQLQSSAQKGLTAQTQPFQAVRSAASPSHLPPAATYQQPLAMPDTNKQQQQLPPNIAKSPVAISLLKQLQVRMILQQGKYSRLLQRSDGGGLICQIHLSHR